MKIRRYYFKERNVGLIQLWKDYVIERFFSNYFKNNNNILNKLLPQKIINKLIYRSFEIRSAEEVDDSKYIKINNNKLVEIEFGDYTCPSYVISPNDKVISEIEIGNNDSLLLGLGILDDKIIDAHKYDIIFNVKFDNNNNNNKNFTIPVNRGKILNRSVGSYFRGKEFIDLEIDLTDFKNEKKKFQLTWELSYDGKLINSNNSVCPKIAIKAPQLLLKQKNELKKIIVLSGESLTDPFWLEKKHNVDLDLKGFNLLASEGLRYENSFSQQDSTFPFMSTIQTGLFSSQHRLGDYEKPIFESKLNSQYLTLSQLLKNENYITEALTTQGRLDTSYGWAKGFDLFKVTKKAWDESAPNTGNINRSLQRYKNYNTFSFFHIDRVHQPILEFVRSQSPNLYNIDILNSAEKGDWYPALFHQIKALDKIIQSVIETLEYESIYDNSLIILTGDHGVAIPPNWKKGLNYALYDEHIRVPTIIKWPKWYEKNKGVNSMPYNASIGIYRVILESLGIDLPEYFSNLPQIDRDYDQYAFSETIYHPQNHNYSLAVMDKDHKYVISYDMDWKKMRLKKILDEKLFMIKKDKIMYDEENDLINNYKNNELVIRDIANEFILKNLSFSI